MTKAEERALEAYPNEHFVDHTYAEMCRGFYEEGYEAAEKDLVLTWEDIRIITKILEEVTDEDIQVEFYNGDAISCYKEVLRRFKEAKK